MSTITCNDCRHRGGPTGPVGICRVVLPPWLKHGDEYDRTTTANQGCSLGAERVEVGV